MHISPFQYSVIIPTKNEANYIGKALAHWQQCWDQYEIEVIVSDGGSRDETAAIVQKFIDAHPNRVRWVQPEGRQNIAIGRNAGAKLAQGRVLFHTDADMRLPDTTSFFKKVEQVFSNPKIIAATAPLWVYPEEALEKDTWYHWFMNGVIRFTFSIGVFLAKGECQLVRREAFESIDGYNEKLIAGEDCNLFYRLSKVGHLHFMGDQKVYHSPRRFRQMGYLKVSWVYLREGLSLVSLRRSFVKEWEPTR